MTKDVMQEIAALYDKINSVEEKFSKFFGTNITAVTPYTETKQAYIGDTEVTFYDVPEGNVTIFFDKPYTMEKITDRITLHFEELEEVTEITISVL